MTFDIKTVDDVHWILEHETQVSIDDADIKTDSILINFLLYHYHYLLLEEIKLRLHYINDYIQSEVNYFNSKITNE